MTASLPVSWLHIKFNDYLNVTPQTLHVTTVHRPEDDPRKECEECGNARTSNVRYYPTWKHSPLKDYWLTNAHELLTSEWLKY
jgi:hypothetical protein